MMTGLRGSGLALPRPHNLGHHVGRHCESKGTKQWQPLTSVGRGRLTGLASGAAGGGPVRIAIDSWNSARASSRASVGEPSPRPQEVRAIAQRPRQSTGVRVPAPREAHGGVGAGDGVAGGSFAASVCALASRAAAPPRAHDARTSPAASRQGSTGDRRGSTPCPILRTRSRSSASERQRVVVPARIASLHSTSASRSAGGGGWGAWRSGDPVLGRRASSPARRTWGQFLFSDVHRPGTSAFEAKLCFWGGADVARRGCLNSALCRQLTIPIWHRHSRLLAIPRPGAGLQRGCSCLAASSACLLFPWALPACARGPCLASPEASAFQTAPLRWWTCSRRWACSGQATRHRAPVQTTRAGWRPCGPLTTWRAQSRAGLWPGKCPWLRQRPHCAPPWRTLRPASGLCSSPFARARRRTTTGPTTMQTVSAKGPRPSGRRRPNGAAASACGQRAAAC